MRFRKVVMASSAVEQVRVHVDVDQVRAAAHLLHGNLDAALIVARLDQPPELQRAGDVLRSPIMTKLVSGVMRNGSRPLRCGVGVALHGRGRGATSCTPGGDGADVLGRGAAAAAHDVHQAAPARTLRAARTWPRAFRRSRRTRWGARRSDSSRRAPWRRGTGPRRTGASPWRRASS